MVYPFACMASLERLVLSETSVVLPGNVVTLHWVWAQVEPVVRMFDIFRSDGRNHVMQSDLKSMLAGILLSHPGLEFLQDTPEFQDRYAETVILRIFYCLDRSGLGRITLRDLKR